MGTGTKTLKCDKKSLHTVAIASICTQCFRYWLSLSLELSFIVCTSAINLLHRLR